MLVLGTAMDRSGAMTLIVEVLSGPLSMASPLVALALIYAVTSVLTEIVFSRPGLGKLILTALTQRDYTLLQGMIVVYTLMVVVVNLATGVATDAYGFTDTLINH